MSCICVQWPISLKVGDRTVSRVRRSGGSRLRMTARQYAVSRNEIARQTSSSESQKAMLGGDELGSERPVWPFELCQDRI